MPNVESTSYHTWRTTPVRVRGGEVLVAHRPGLPGAGPADVAHLLLAEHVQVESSDAVVVLNGGSGLVGVVAAGPVSYTHLRAHET